MGSRRLYPRPDTAICGIFQISFYDNLFNPNKNSKIQNKTKLNKKTIEILLNELFVLDDQQQNEKLINEYANEHDITVIFDNNIVTQSLTQKHLGMFLDTKLDFQEHLKSIFSKVNRQLVYYGNFTTYCRDRLYLQFISPLLDLISTMVTSYMIKHITFRFTKNLTLLNTTQHWL